jgi:hypothetical protein
MKRAEAKRLVDQLRDAIEDSGKGAAKLNELLVQYAEDYPEEFGDLDLKAIKDLNTNIWKKAYTKVVRVYSALYREVYPDGHPDSHGGEDQ